MDKKYEKRNEYSSYPKNINDLGRNGKRLSGPHPLYMGGKEIFEYDGKTVIADYNTGKLS